MVDWTKQAVSASEALACVRSGMRIFVQGAAATSTPLLEALAARRDLADVTLYHMHTNGPAPFAERLGRARSEPYDQMEMHGAATRVDRATQDGRLGQRGR